MIQVKPTRNELLKAKRRILLARKGHELLKKKQDSLIMEFFSLLKEVKGKREQLQKAYASAARKLKEARALESDLRMKAVAMAVTRHAPLTLETRNIAGVRLPQITLEKEQGIAVYDSLLTQDVGQAYQGVIRQAVDLAAQEAALRKLLIEIKKVKRRAYSLEHRFIPDMQAAVQHVRFSLEEREREEFSRLKRMKRN